MKVVAIIMKAVNTFGLIVTAAIRIRAGFYSNDHPGLCAQFDSVETDLVWICCLAIFSFVLSFQCLFTLKN